MDWIKEALTQAREKVQLLEQLARLDPAWKPSTPAEMVEYNKRHGFMRDPAVEPADPYFTNINWFGSGRLPPTA